MAYPTLNVNKINAALYNQIISQDIIGGSIANNYNLVSKARVDGTLYGDTKLYYSVGTTVSEEWDVSNLRTANHNVRNVLIPGQDAPVHVQTIVMDKFRQTSIILDSKVFKQAFMSESGFANYQTILTGRLNKCKEMYDTLTYNSFFGTLPGVSGTDVTITLSDGSTHEKNEMDAEAIAQSIADLISDMKDYNTKYTKTGFIRAFTEDEINIVWNVNYINKIRKVSLPTIFHNENLIDKFGGDTLPARFFGNVKTTAVTTSGNTGQYRSLIEQVINNKHYWPGDKIDSGVAINANTAYEEDAKVICKVYTKLPPYMSAFNVTTSFQNPKSLDTNMYQTWGHNTLAALDDEAYVVVKKA